MESADTVRRIGRLERECRLLRGAVALGVLGLAAVAALGQAALPPKVVQAEAFQVVDGAGKVLATLGPDKPMRCALRFHAENGDAQVALGNFEAGGGLFVIMQDASDPACVLSAVPGKVSGLTLLTKGKEHAVLLNANDRGGAVLCRSAGADAGMAVYGGNAEISLGKALDTGGSRPSATLTRFAAGDACLKLWDKDGKLFHCVPEGAHPEHNPK